MVWESAMGHDRVGGGGVTGVTAPLFLWRLLVSPTPPTPPPREDVPLPAIGEVAHCYRHAPSTPLGVFLIFIFNLLLSWGVVVLSLLPSHKCTAAPHKRPCACGGLRCTCGLGGGLRLWFFSGVEGLCW